MPRLLLRVLRRDVPFLSTALLAAVVLAWCSAAAAPVPRSELKALTNSGEVCLQSTKGVNDFTHGLDKVGNHGGRALVINQVQLRDADGLEVVGAYQASVHHEGLLRGTSSGWTTRGQGLRRLRRTIPPGEDVAIVLHLRRSSNRTNASMSGLTIQYSAAKRAPRTLRTQVAFRVAAPRC